MSVGGDGRFLHNTCNWEDVRAQSNQAQLQSMLAPSNNPFNQGIGSYGASLNHRICSYCGTSQTKHKCDNCGANK